VSEFFILVLSGAVAGALYAIMASGLVLTYSTSGVFNFAFGAIAFVAAVVYFELHTGAHVPIVPAAFIAIGVVSPLTGLFLDKIMFRKLASAGSTAQIVATVGLMIAIPAACIFVVERLISVGHLPIPSLDNVVVPPGVGPTPAPLIHLSSTVAINTNQVAALAAAVVTAALLWILTTRTTLGLRMRATVDQRQLASLRGVNPDRTSSSAWMIGTTLAGLAGVLGAPILSLGPDSFTQLMLISASAAVFARLRSIPVAFASGIGLGVAGNLVAGYLNHRVHLEGLSSAFPFLLLFAGLLVLNRPRSGQARTPTEEAAPATHDADLSFLRRYSPWLAAAVVLVGFILIGPKFWVGLVAAGLCVGLIFMSFVVVTGIGGMISLAQATFVSCAGLSAGLFVSHGMPFLAALLLGTAVATFVGVIVALPALRLGGVMLGLATLALGYICDLLIFQLGPIDNHTAGWNIPRPAIGPIHFSSDRTMALLLFVLVVLVVLLVESLKQSASGRAMFAVRSSSVAAAASGVSPVRVKLSLFAVSSAIAGFGGILYASFRGSVTVGDFPAFLGLIWLAVMVTFGVRRPLYAVVAGLVFALSPQIISYATTSVVIPQIFFGLGGVGLARHPDGFISEFKERARRRRATRMAAGGAGAAAVAVTVATSGAMAAAATPAVKRSPATSEVPGALAEGLSQPADLRSQAYAGNTGTAEPVAVAGDGRGPATLELVGVSAGYGQARVLHHTDIALRPGTALGLLGANGAGKSTLCKVAGGLLAPTAGAVLFEGEDITARAPFWRSRHGLVLAPEARSVFPNLTVEENLRLQVHERATRDGVLDRWPILAARRNVAAGLLSGGEQRLLAIAPLLFEPPKVLIADEPSLGLAPRFVTEVFALLEELRRQGVALLVVEEKMRDIVAFADDIAVMELGRIELVVAADDIDANRLAARYLHAASGTS
jgi:ABC-type branched-subunit amino acid transport system ATPase component/branched-subunit amino acid ABC-type transport system permease component